MQMADGEGGNEEVRNYKLKEKDRMRHVDLLYTEG